MADFTHWFFGVEGQGFWKDTHTDDHSPTAVLNFQTEIMEQRHMLIGGRDGYVRRYDRLSDDDDGESITSGLGLRLKSESISSRFAVLWVVRR